MSEAESKKTSVEGDHALECFVALFLLRFVRMWIFKALSGLLAISLAVTVSLVQVACAALIIHLFRRRMQSARVAEGKPITRWKWSVLGFATFAFLTETIALFISVLKNIF